MIQKIKNTLLCAVFLASVVSNIQSQELNLDVRVLTPALKIADPTTFKIMETAIKEFMNNTVWTDDEFEKHERIEGSIQINIKDDLSGNQFVADILVSSARPVFNSSYYTPVMNHIDKDVAIFYEQNQPIYSNKTGFSDNLSAVLTFYAYVLLGMDYDTFAPTGGEKYFNIAQTVVNSVPIGSSEGWTAANGRNNSRYWILENLLNPRVRPFRIAYYEYHRQSLDKMGEDTEKARAVMLSALQSMTLVNKNYPNTAILKLFSDTKRDEIKEIFKAGGQGEKSKVYDIIAAIDPAQQNEFKEFRRFR